MTVYKLRRKSDGHFLSSGGWYNTHKRFHPTRGRTFPSRAALSNHLGRAAYDHEMEVVAYELQETGTQTLAEFLRG